MENEQLLDGIEIPKLKDIALYAFTTNVTLSNITDDEYGTIQRCEFEKESILLLSLNSVAIKVVATRIDVISETKMANFITYNDDGTENINCQLYIDGCHLNIYDREAADSDEGESFYIKYTRYSPDILNDEHETSKVFYPMYKWNVESGVANGTPFYVATIMLKLSGEGNWQEVMRVNSPTFQNVNIAVTDIINKLKTINPFFLSSKNLVNNRYFIDDKLYELISLEIGYGVFKLVNLEEDDIEDDEEYMNFYYMHLSAANMCIVIKNMIFPYGPYAIYNDKIVGEVDDLLSEVYTTNPLELDDCLFQRFQVLLIRENDLRNKIINNRILREDGLEMYKMLLTQSKQMIKEYRKVSNKLIKKIEGLKTREFSIGGRLVGSYGILSEERLVKFNSDITETISELKNIIKLSNKNTK